MAMIEREEQSPSYREKPLRLSAPELYTALLTELGRLHLHPYDIQAAIVKEDAGVKLVLRYGEELAYRNERVFDEEIPKPSDPGVTAYFSEAAENCKKVLMAEYFKWMKP